MNLIEFREEVVNCLTRNSYNSRWLPLHSGFRREQGLYYLSGVLS